MSARPGVAAEGATQRLRPAADRDAAGVGRKSALSEGPGECSLRRRDRQRIRTKNNSAAVALDCAGRQFVIAIRPAAARKIDTASVEDKRGVPAGIAAAKANSMTLRAAPRVRVG